MTYILDMYFVYYLFSLCTNTDIIVVKTLIFRGIIVYMVYMLYGIYIILEQRMTSFPCFSRIARYFLADTDSNIPCLNASTRSQLCTAEVLLIGGKF